MNSMYNTVCFLKELKPKLHVNQSNIINVSLARDRLG